MCIRDRVFGRPGVLVKVSDPAEENLDFVAYETCLEIINLRQYPDPIDGFDYRGAEYPLRISAFAKGLRYYRNERAWRKAETRLAKEAMIPDECLKQRREKDPDPVCFLSGIVGAVSYTHLALFWRGEAEAGKREAERF